jgi:hypothetical protein
MVLLQERLQGIRQFAMIAAALPQLAGDLLGDVARPPGGGVEGDDPHRAAILPLHQVPDQNRALGILLRRLAPRAAQLAEIFE